MRWRCCAGAGAAGCAGAATGAVTPFPLTHPARVCAHQAQTLSVFCARCAAGGEGGGGYSVQLGHPGEVVPAEVGCDGLWCDGAVCGVGSPCVLEGVGGTALHPGHAVPAS